MNGNQEKKNLQPRPGFSNEDIITLLREVVRTNLEIANEWGYPSLFATPSPPTEIRGQKEEQSKPLNRAGQK